MSTQVKTIKDHLVSGAVGAAYGGVVGAAGGTLGMAGGVATGLAAAIAIPCLEDKAPNVKLKAKSFLVTAAAGFGLACTTCSPTLATRVEDVFSRKEATPAQPVPAMMPFPF